MKRSREPEDRQPPSSPQPASGTGVDKAAVSATDDDLSGAGVDLEGPPAKFIDVDPDSSSNGPDGGRGTTTPTTMITCLLHRDRVKFSRMETYETHYKKEHLNRCLECRRNFPSPLYLSLHGDECHDPFVAVKRDRGEHTYGCFVEGCERKCASADKRRRHLIDKHSFPKNFFFAITQYGTDGRTSLLDDGFRRHSGPPPLAQKQHHRRKSSVADGSGGSNGNGAKSPPPLSTEETAQHQVASSGDAPQRKDERAVERAAGGGGKAAPTRMVDAMEEDSDEEDTDDESSSSDSGPSDDAGQVPDVQMDDLATAMSAVSFVPRSVRFGRGRKAGFARR